MVYILSEKEYDGAVNLPVIQICYIDNHINFSLYDALVFTSKNGIIAIKDKFEQWQQIPTFCIGSATSSEVKKLGGKVTYSARNSYGDLFAHEIKELLFQKKALFVRAKVVTSNLNEILKNAGVILEEVIVYETVCGKFDFSYAPQKNAFIIFSSPSTIECFFENFSWDDSYTAIVIGEVTASYMPKQINYKMASEPNIPSCIHLAQTLLFNVT